MLKTKIRMARHGIRFDDTRESDIPEIVSLDPGDRVDVPLWQYHSNIPFEICVRRGLAASKGMFLAQPLDERGVCVHAPVGGIFSESKVARLAGPQRPWSQVLTMLADSKPVESADYAQHTQAGEKHANERLRSGGMRGLGGACYPTHLKMGQQRVAVLIANLMETDPEIMCDRSLIKLLGPKRTLELIGEVAALLEIPRALVAVPEGTFVANKIIKERLPAGVEVKPLQPSYALGNSKLLHAEMARAGNLGSVGTGGDSSMVLNFQTICAVRDLLAGDKPLTSRLVTVTSERESVRIVFRIPFGTSLSRIRDVWGCVAESASVRCGGFASGARLSSDDLVGPMTNSVVFFAEDEPASREQPCISCGLCDLHCPAKISPRDLLRLVSRNQESRAGDEGLMECVMCGTCDWVCPSRIPIAALLGKAMRSNRESEEIRQRKISALDRKQAADNRRDAESMRYTNPMSRDDEAGIVNRLVAGAVSGAATAQPTAANPGGEGQQIAPLDRAPRG